MRRASRGEPSGRGPRASCGPHELLEQSTARPAASGLVGHEQRVDAAAHLELLLEPRQRHEHGADVALLRLQRELAERLRAAARRRPSAAASGRDRPCGRAAIRSARRSVAARARGWRFRAPAPSCSASAGLTSASRSRGASTRRRRGIARNGRRRRTPPPGQLCVRSACCVTTPRATISGASPLKLVANRGSAWIAARARRGRTRGCDHEVRASEPLEHEVAQAATHGIAHEQRSREHRHSRGDAQHHRQVRSPVEGEPTKDELCTAHVLGLFHHTRGVAHTNQRSIPALVGARRGSSRTYGLRDTRPAGSHVCAERRRQSTPGDRGRSRRRWARSAPLVRFEMRRAISQKGIFTAPGT